MELIYSKIMERVTWRSLREGPEEVPIFGLHVKWVCVKKLAHIITEIFVELSHGLANAVIKVAWLILNHLGNCCFFLSFCSRSILCFYYLFECLRVKSENFAENISAPLNTMNGFLREHF